LARVEVERPRALAVAPTGDLTDDPSRLGVYVADAGGGITELSLAAPVKLAAASFTSSLVKTTNTALWTPPSPDASGIAYLPATNRLLVVDGEVEEAPSGITHFRGANAWETTLGGSVVRAMNISTLSPRVAPFSDEPTGAAWNSSNGHYYISDDDARRVFDVNPGGDGLFATSDDTWTSFDTTRVGNDDPEGIAYDSFRNRIFVADGVNAEIYEYTTSGTLVAHFDVARHGVSDPETVEFNRDNGRLLVLGKSSNNVLVETTTAGAVTQTMDVSASPASSPAGLAHGPASDGSGARRYYIVDRGVDNDSDPRAVDGKLFELTAPAGPTTPGNLPPTVGAGPDRTVELPNAALLDGSVTDDGLPNPPARTTATWSKVSGPGSVTFADPSAVDTTATISSPGTYVLRLTASDAELSSFDEMSVTATGAGGAASLDVRVSAASDDAEESATGSVSLSSSDLELAFDGSNQAVGIRFTGISIPRGTAIRDAYVQFTVDEVTTGAVALSIAAVAADNTPTFTSSTGNVSSRPRTASSVAWSPPDWPTIGAAVEAQRTPGLAAIVQEIVNRPGWASGNSLALVVTGTGRRTAEAFDGSSPQAPLLHIEYGGTTSANTAPSVSISAPQSGATVAQGSPVSFAGSASDTQDGDVSPSLAWSSSIDGPIGTGAGFTTSSLSLGTHTITARVTDSGGLTGSAQITLTVTSTNTAPSVTISAPPNQAEVAAGTAVTFTGSATDAQEGDVSAALAWRSSIDGAIGNGSSVTTSTLSAGIHTITASATDSGGLTGSAQTTLTVTGPDLIFADGFESGNLSRWTSSSTGGGDLAVTTGAAALAGSFGLRALVNDNNSMWVSDDTPAAEPRYRARFAFDPNSMAMGTSDSHYIFTGRTTGGTTVFRIELRRSSGIYQVRLGCLNDAGSFANTSWAAIPDAPLTLEIDWKAATAAGAADGSSALWINGVASGGVNGIDNDTRRVDLVRLGAASGIDTATRGTYYFDRFESRRTTFIGP
jgi:chitodextrinase